MKACHQCRALFVPSARARRYCTPDCRDTAMLARRRVREREAYRRAHPEGRRYTLREEEDVGLGPELPLNGVSETQAQRQRRARLLRAIRDGLEIDALRERFGLERNVIQQAASRAGLRIARTGCAYGVPA